MYSHEQLIEFHNEARQIKEHQWYEHGEPDPPPLLVVRWRDMQPQAIDVAQLGTIIETFRKVAIKRGMRTWLTVAPVGAPLVLWAALGAAADGVQLPGCHHVPKKGTPIESIWLACEGYGIEADDEGDTGGLNIDEIQRGDLKRDFETNPASKVVERLTTYQVETSALGTAEWGRVTAAFHKDDGGRIIWHDPPRVDTSEGSEQEALDPDGSFDRLLEIMIPHVTREKLA